MASLKQIKRRIKTAKNIAQITKAMEMVAASKMKRAQNQALASKPYAAKLYSVTAGLANLPAENLHPFLFANKEQQEKQTLFVVIASEKGLCGSLVSNLGRELLTLTEPNNLRFITLGKKARDLILRINGQILAHFELGLSQPKFEIVPSVVNIITEKFLHNEVKNVFALYTDFINTMSQKSTIKQLLPVTDISPLNSGFTDYLFEPSPAAILDTLLPHYLEMEIYQIILEAYASEQSARMVAMKNATDNASEITQELTLIYNKLRQTAITNEIADIVTASLTI